MSPPNASDGPPPENRDEPSDSIPRGSIKVTTRDDCHRRTTAVHKLLRPFGHQLTKPGKSTPAGSLRLTPPSKTTDLCDIQERQVEEIWIYDLALKRSAPQDEKRIDQHRIYYFVGGGWQSPPSPSHWKFLTAMLRKLPTNTIISLTSYPLAPKNAAPKSFPQLLKLYRTLMSDSVRDNEVVTFAGDSAGGNIVLCLVMEALFQEPTSPAPYSILAICPSVDMRRDNPKMDSIRKQDPLLRQFFIESTASTWTDHWNLSDRRVSPIEADITSLRKAGVKTDGLTAGYDLLGPDGVLFRDKLDENGVEGIWLHWEKQMHCWPLAASYGIIPESDEAFNWIVDTLSMRGREGIEKRKL